MMNNKLFEEVNRIKTIMGINYDDVVMINESVESECEKKLEKAGYKVYSPYEQKGMDETCKDDEKIKCIMKKFTDAGKVEGTEFKIHKNKGLCYLVSRTNEKISISLDGETSEIPKNTWTFFANGDVSYIRSLPIVHTKEMMIDGLKPNFEKLEDTSKIAQIHYIGQYKCDSTEITWTNMRLLGYYNFKQYNTLVEKGKQFMLSKSDGTAWKLSTDLVSTAGTFDASSR